MTFPIPIAALDDRLGFIGTSGSGKTYNACAAVERLIARKARVVIVDPLGVWWGLRLLADGKTPSHFNIVIFGGPRGDLPLNEHAGALIGETAATMSESCIVDLTQLGTKSAERRFMTSFLETIYRKASGEPFHLVVDESDLFAPQKPPKGDETLLNLMEQIVRRGRVKGFIPWLISQRPAVLNKNVLSQVDGLVAFKLTSSQDRDALDAWIEGQADKAQGRAIKDSLPAMQVGQGIVWCPGRGMLDTVAFPAKETFDSSRTPKRGEKLRAAELRPLNVEALRSRLSAVVDEVEANDPRRLKARIVELERALASQPKAGIEEDEIQCRISEASQQGQYLGQTGLAEKVSEQIAAVDAMLENLRSGLAHVIGQEPPSYRGSVKVAEFRKAIAPSSNGLDPSAKLKPSLQRVIDAIGWWSKIGKHPIPRDRACVVAGLSPKASTFGVYVAELVRMGLVESTPGFVGLTAEGFKHAAIPIAASRSDLYDCAAGLLAPQERKIFDIVYAAYPQDIRRDKVAEKAGLSPTASTAGVYMAAVAAYGIIEPAQRGCVRAADWLFP